jgi:hypothetical protein
MEQGQPETRQTRLRSVTPTLRAPTKLQNDVFAIERHNDLESRDVSKGSPRSIASRWILSCFSKLLCISIAMTKFCTRGDRITIDSVKVGAHAFNHATRIGPIPRPRPESRHCPSSSPGFRTTIAGVSNFWSHTLLFLISRHPSPLFIDKMLSGSRTALRASAQTSKLRLQLQSSTRAASAWSQVPQGPPVSLTTPHTH